MNNDDQNIEPGALHNDHPEPEERMEADPLDPREPGYRARSIGAPRQADPVAGRRKLLVIAYYYPPMGLSGVLRIAKFTKYLRNYGWEPTVLTVGDVGYFAYDYSLLEEVLEAGVKIERTGTLDPLRLFRRKGTIKMPPDGRRRMLSGLTHVFLQPDNKIGWKRYALKRALELAKHEHFDAILATAPPFTSFLIGQELQKRLGIPLVVDYRDPWLDNRNYFYATPLHRGYAAGLEEAVLKNSDGVVVVNRKIKEKLIARYPFLTHEAVHIIPSGYDPQDFRLANRFPLPRSRKMRFTYSGLFDARRTPKFFFMALAKIFAQYPETRDEIEVCFIGTFQESFRKMATQLGVSSALVTTDYVEHHQAVRNLLASDVLWLTIYDPSITPGKVYEYIGSRKPILALAPEGIVRTVLNDYGAATFVDPEDVDGIAAAIHTLYIQWREEKLPVGNEGLAREHDQRHLTERLARILAYSLRI
ncbi:MAG: glycosyltransferase [Candidatus Kapaibacterium sp.]